MARRGLDLAWKKEAGLRAGFDTRMLEVME